MPLLGEKAKINKNLDILLYLHQYFQIIFTEIALRGKYFPDLLI